MAKEKKYPKAIYNWPEEKSSAALVFIHNHLSGEPQPSQDDIEITNRIISACYLVGIKVLDHIIIGDTNYLVFSMKDL